MASGGFKDHWLHLFTDAELDIIQEFMQQAACYPVPAYFQNLHQRPRWASGAGSWAWACLVTISNSAIW